MNKTTAVLCAAGCLLAWAGWVGGGESTAAESSKPQGAVRAYPLDTCVVSGEKLGGMGAPVTLVTQGQEVKFCCKGCVAKFEKDPQKYLALIAEAAKKKEASASVPAPLPPPDSAPKQGHQHGMQAAPNPQGAHSSHGCCP